MELLTRTAGNVLAYVLEMLPLALLALGVLALLAPWRRGRLAKRGLVSPGSREGVLAIFVAFCGGLGAITYFPAGFWDLATHLRYGWPSEEFFSWETAMSALGHLDNLLTPFQEIRRAFRVGSYWLWFLLVGNIVMFMPLGFFPKLLFRKWSWWKSLLLGFGVSVSIELAQLFTTRSTDIDDVILNTLGALLGWLLGWIVERLWPRGVENCKVREVLKWT